MKNWVRLVRVVVFAAVTVLLFTACGEKGGTLVIKNETGDDIYGYAISGYFTEKELKELNQDDTSALTRAVKTITKGESSTWPFSSNGNVTWCWSFDWRGNIEYSEIVKLEKGVDKTVTAKL